MSTRVLRALLAFVIAATVTALTSSSASAAEPVDAVALRSWQTGDPVPSGYHAETPKGGAIAAVIGGSLFLSGYVPALLVGGIGAMYCAGIRYLGECDAGVPAQLLIPLVGPFLVAGHTDGRAESMLITDGVIQIAGVVTAVAGALVDSDAKPSLVPDKATTAGPAPKVSVRVLPSVGQGSTGLMVLGSF
jgi:hypothetical protein